LKNGFIINAASFWPSFLISQRILRLSLGAVKLESLLLKTFLDQDLSNVLINRQEGILPGSLRFDSPSKKEEQGKIGHLNRGFSFYLGVSR
jgi:hypothetical protein